MPLVWRSRIAGREIMTLCCRFTQSGRDVRIIPTALTSDPHAHVRIPIEVIVRGWARSFAMLRKRHQ